MVKKKKSTTPKVDVVAADVSVESENSAECQTDDAKENVDSAAEETEPTTQIGKTSMVEDYEEDPEEDPGEDLTLQVAETPTSAVIEDSRETLNSNSSLNEEMVKMESSNPIYANKVSAAVTADIKETDNITEYEENKFEIPSIGGEPVSTTIETDKSNGKSFNNRENDEPSSEQPSENTPAEVPSKGGPGESDESKDAKEGADAEMLDATSSRDNALQPENPATARSTGPKTLFIGNLPYNVDKDKLIEFFKDAGEVVEVRLGYHDDGRSKGYGHVDFATAEELEKALSLNGTNLLGRPLKLDIAHEKGSRPASGEKNSSEQKGKRTRSQRVFIRGFDTSLPEEEIRSALMAHFDSCGEIASMSIPMERGTSTVKGIAYIEFNDTDSFDKALNLDGTKLGERHLTVQEANPKDENRGGSGGGGSKRGGGGGGSRRSGGGGGSKRSSGGDRRVGASRYGMGHDRYDMPDSRYGMPDSRYGMPDGRYGMPGGRYGMPDGRYGMPDSRYGLPDGRYGLPDGRYGMPGGQMGMGGGWYGGSDPPYVGNDIYGRPVGGGGIRGGVGGRGGGGRGGRGRGGGRF